MRKEKLGTTSARQHCGQHRTSTHTEIKRRGAITFGVRENKKEAIFGWRRRRGWRLRRQVLAAVLIATSRAGNESVFVCAEERREKTYLCSPLPA